MKKKEENGVKRNFDFSFSHFTSILPSHLKSVDKSEKGNVECGKVASRKRTNESERARHERQNEEWPYRNWKYDT